MGKGDSREDRQEPEREVFTDFTGGAPGSVTKPAEEIQPVFIQHGNFISGTCKNPGAEAPGAGYLTENSDYCAAANRSY